MKASIEKIKRNIEGFHVLEVVVNDPDAEQLRLGAIDLTQRKYEQKKIGGSVNNDTDSQW